MRILILIALTTFFPLAAEEMQKDLLLDRSSLSSFERLLSKEEIEKRVHEVAKQIDDESKGEDLTLVLILKGAICIGSDLMRALSSPISLETIQTSSYGAKGSCRGELVISGLEKLNLEGKHVLVVDDVFDSGITLATVVEKLRVLKPKTLRSLVLLTKKIPHKVDYRPTYTLFEIEDRFVVGYGMDYKEYWRGLPAVFAVR